MDSLGFRKPAKDLLMSYDVVIRVSGLSKIYHVYDQPSDRLKQLIVGWFQRFKGAGEAKFFREFYALKNVSFDVKKGETVGIVGRNGSGKSTLLQIICGTLNPSSGEVEAKGRIGALLELGSGFNPEFSGRENIYMNGAVLGLTKDEIDSCYKDIVEFADIGEFIDQPVKVYSSGMLVRLAFAVQAQVTPDILIVDEALAVGDAKFQAKCFARLQALKDRGTSILLVTHSSEQIVSHCSRAILLDRGSILDFGEPRGVVNRYMDLLFGKERNTKTPIVSVSNGLKEKDVGSFFPVSIDAELFASHDNYNPGEYRWGDGKATLLDFYIATEEESYPPAIDSGQLLTLIVSIRFEVDIPFPVLGITIKTKEGITISGANSETLDVADFRELGKQGTVAVVKSRFSCNLGPGDYFISLGVATKNGDEVIPHDRRYDSIHLQVRPVENFFGLVDLALQMELQGVV